MHSPREEERAVTQRVRQVHHKTKAEGPSCLTCTCTAEGGVPHNLGNSPDVSTCASESQPTAIVTLMVDTSAPKAVERIVEPIQFPADITERTSDLGEKSDGVHSPLLVTRAFNLVAETGLVIHDQVGRPEVSQSVFPAGHCVIALTSGRT